MLTRKARILLTASALLTLPLGGAWAATIESWNLTNIAEGDADLDDTDDIGGASVVYDRDVTGGIGEAITYGKVTYIAPESNTPGIKIDNDDYEGAKKQEFDGCIMASSEASCDSDFQSGKRIKQQVTDVGAIDLVFDIASVDGETTNLYQVFHRLINVSGDMLAGFTVELGTGIGSGFTQSTVGDGLSFAQTVSFGPDDLAAFSQYPFGLFGGDPLNPNPLNLPGFFDTVTRAGFDVDLGEDKMTSTGYYGSYDDLFGNWLSQEDVPNGIFYDFDPGNADPLLLAWDTGTGWDFRRLYDAEGNPVSLFIEPIASQFVAYADLFGFLEDNFGALDFTFIDGVLAGDLIAGAIEDLANLNLTFALTIEDRFAMLNNSFTMRVTPIAPIPLPAGAPLLIGALGALALLRRRARLAA